ncbi:hypothetical protein R3P38DRAFT_2801918 [Favolaschia claudopus]|uniref:Uncharacterized protein n=1 Tax=Favolaschia claudopus TaxID=2862362 RepID=A0AAV9ZVC8_9AGAR
MRLSWHWMYLQRPRSISVVGSWEKRQRKIAKSQSENHELAYSASLNGICRTRVKSGSASKEKAIADETRGLAKQETDPEAFVGRSMLYTLRNRAKNFMWKVIEARDSVSGALEQSGEGERGQKMSAISSLDGDSVDHGSPHAPGPQPLSGGVCGVQEICEGKPPSDRQAPRRHGIRTGCRGRRMEASASISGYPNASYCGYPSVAACIKAWQALCSWGVHPHPVDPAGELEDASISSPPGVDFLGPSPRPSAPCTPSKVKGKTAGGKDAGSSGIVHVWTPNASAAATRENMLAEAGRALTTWKADHDGRPAPPQNPKPTFPPPPSPDPQTHEEQRQEGGPRPKARPAWRGKGDDAGHARSEREGGGRVPLGDTAANEQQRGEEERGGGGKRRQR